MTKPDLALIHGWGLGHGIWTPCVELLNAFSHIYPVKLPGYGEVSDSGETFTQVARSITNALPAGITLCGWSLGSLLAMQAALLAPERVGQLILVAGTPCFAQRDDWKDAQPASLLNGFADAVDHDAKATLQRFAALMNQADTKARQISREITRGVLSSSLPPVATLQRGLAWLRDIDLRDRLPEIACPVLLIHGENDPLMPLSAARWLAERLPQAQLEIFCGAAHAPFLNDPERFARLVGDFLHGHSPDQTTRP